MANQIVVSAGAKVRNLQDVIIGTSGVLTSLGFDVANGVPRLDVNGKILVSQLPNSVMEYKGTWSAATNTPTLANGTGNQGDVYLCNVAGTVDFGAGPIAFVVGDQVIYSGSIWQRASGATGTVTSVAVTESGDSLNITGSPITTSGTINIGFNGTNLQYVNGAGNLTTFPTLITSIGLSMPSAFSVANSPLTANGTIAVTGAGVASQYIRGDGTLADFPSSGGGGSSVSYYLNGGTSQGTIGGTTYYEMSKTAVIGTGVDFTKTGDGFIVAFLTDANDPAQLNIPAGNWNYEIYASMSSNGGTPAMYAELYVYDGTTFTLISTSANEIIYDGTALNLYTFAMAVPATSLTLTDRLAIKLYATNSGGKTTTIHTQDSHLCQIITTFSTGITALNGLTAQVQYFQTGTSGTDFNISSTTATHTFNIPDASATARGLITTGTQTIAGTKTFSDATKNNGGIFLQNASSSSLAGYMNIGGLTNGVKFTSGGGISNTFTLPSATGYTFTFPNATGTIALTSDISYPVTSVFGRTGAVVATSGDYTTAQVTESGNLYFTDSRARLALSLTTTGTSGAATYNNTTGVFNIPNYAPDLSGYVTLAGTQTITGAKTFSTFTKFDGGVILKNNVSASLAGYVGLSAYSASGNKGINIDFDTYSASFYFSGTLPYQYTFPAASGTIALVGGSGVGTVTSVAALTIGTSGTDLSSSVANSTTTPVITLNVPTASATNRGALSSADWTTFNNKQATITLTTTGTSGAATFTSNTLNIPNYGSALSGYLPLTGGTLTGALGGTSAVFTSSVTAALLTITSGSGTKAIWATTRAFGVNRNFQIAVDEYAEGEFTITPSTTQGGSGYTTPIFKLAATGLAQFVYADTSYNAGITVKNTTNSVGAQSRINISDSANNFLALIKNPSAASSGSALIATSSTEDLVLGVNYQDYIHIYNGGNIGLSTTSNGGYKLDVNGTGRFTANNAALTVTSASTTGYASLTFDADFRDYVIGVGGSAAGVTEVRNSFYVYDNTAGQVRLTIASTGAATFSNSFTTSDTSALFLSPSLGTNQTVFLQLGKNIADTYNSGEMSFKFVASGSSSNMVSLGFYGAGQKLNVLGNGNVGIGTVSPNFKTHISTGSDTSITQPTAGTYGLYIQQNTSGNIGGLYIQDGASNSGNSIFVGDNNGAARFVVNTDGNVGIGQSPQSILETFGASPIVTITDGNTFSSGVARTSGIEFKALNPSGNNTTQSAGIYGVITPETGYTPNAGYLTFYTRLQGGSYSEKMRITSGGDIEIASGSIKTGTPSGGTAKPWKLGQDTSTLYSATRTIQVEIDGGTYYLLAVKSTDL